MEARDTKGEVVFTSAYFRISYDVTNFFGIELEAVGDFAADDYVEVYYQIDGDTASTF